MSKLPDFIEHGGQQALLQPYSLKRVQLQVFLLDANNENLTNLLNRVFKTPSGGAIQYHPLVDKVMLVFSVTQDSSPANPMGSIPEIDVAFWQFTWAEDPLRLGFYMPYIFVNTPYAMISGREVYGFAKTMGQFQIPSLDEPPDHFLTSAMVFETSEPQQMASLKPVIEVKRMDSGDGARTSLWNNFEEVGKDLIDPIFGGSRIHIPGLGVVINVLEHFMNLDVKLAFLKQFREVSDGDFACYQAINEAPMRTGTFYGGGLMTGDYQVTVHDYASTPIVTDLGISHEMNAKMAFWADFDFVAENGTVLWKAS